MEGDTDSIQRLERATAAARKPSAETDTAERLSSDSVFTQLHRISEKANQDPSLGFTSFSPLAEQGVARRGVPAPAEGREPGSRWSHRTSIRAEPSDEPGMICLWHIRGQPRDFDTWVRKGLEYIDHWSLWLDLRILCGAVFYVVRGKNY